MDRVGKLLIIIMKKLILLSIISFGLLINANAQFKVGGGLTMATKMGIDDNGDDKMGFGVQLRAYKGFSESMGVAGGFTYFFPSAPEGITLKAMEVFADFHYNFITNETMDVYGLAGLSYAYAKVEVDGFGEADDSKIGLNIGAGMTYKTGSLDIFGELKYNTAFENIMISAGVLIPIGE